MSDSKFILQLKKHKTFGIILLPVIITKKHNFDFFDIEHLLTTENSQKIDFPLTDYQQRIIKIATQYTDSNIAKKIAPKKSVQEFMSSLTAEIFNNRIIPHIERLMAKCLDLALEYRVEVFYNRQNIASLFDSDRLTITPNKTNTIFNFERFEDGLKYYISAGLKDKDIKLTHSKAEIITNKPCWVLIKNAIYNFEDIDSKKLVPFFDKDYIHIPKRLEEKYFDGFIYQTIKKYKIKNTGFNITTIPTKKTAVASLERDFTNRLALVLHFYYNHHKYQYADGINMYCKKVFSKNTFDFEKYYRDIEWEKSCYQLFIEKGLTLSGESHLVLTAYKEGEDDTYNFAEWINNNIEKIKDAKIQLQYKYDQKDYFFGKSNLKINIKPKKNKKQKIDWFDVHATVEIGTFSIPFSKFRNNIVNEIREYKLPNGQTVILPKEWFSKYKDLFVAGEEIMGFIRIQPNHFSVLDDDIVGVDNKYKEQLSLLSKGEGFVKTMIPKAVKATLRDYQHTGYSWLYSLQSQGFGGCLADDMGLGKTLQTITLLAKCHEEYKTLPQAGTQLSLFYEQDDLKDDGTKENSSSKTSLIVVPVSLIHNWENEIKKFAPHLKTLIYRGSNRKEHLNSIQYYDIVISSYGTVRNDSAELSSVDFFYLILDESQMVKNPQSKVFKAIKELRATNKLILTGTPIENSLTDLWAQMDVINENLLGNIAYFKNEFLLPIQKQNDEEKTLRLKKLLQPFILRRTKDEVLKELPPLSEQTIYCEMPKDQKKVYDEENSKVRNAIMDLVEKKQMKKSGFIILEALSKLRMYANHPKMKDTSYSGDSGKFGEIIRNINNLIAENHKVLIFSSFVKHLNLIAEYLEEERIDYSMLTGKTSNRSEAISKFENNPSVNVFLISIKAGGVGLNLVSADYVFIIDPWWNPAVESQAINRAHRMGQKKSVFVYRYITKDTIEERIQNLQQQKKQLANTFINDNNPLSVLKKSELQELFK